MNTGPNDATEKKDRPRAMIWVDGQNLFHGVKKLFDRREPDYDIVALSKALCESKGWELGKLFFYTGMPTHEEQPHWAGYWERKLDRMREQGAPVEIYAPPLRYHTDWVRQPNGYMQAYRRPVEKGVDVRLALDMVAAVYERSCDVMAVFSQDNDLSEAVDRCRQIAASQERKILIVSVFPDGGPRHGPARGIRNTEWICFDRRMYESCLDLNGWENGHHPDYPPHQHADAHNEQTLLDRGQRAREAVGSAQQQEHRVLRTPA